MGMDRSVSIPLSFATCLPREAVFNRTPTEVIGRNSLVCRFLTGNHECGGSMAHTRSDPFSSVSSVAAVSGAAGKIAQHDTGADRQEGSEWNIPRPGEPADQAKPFESRVC